MSPGYRTVLSHDPAAFEALRSEWNPLLARSAAANIFLSWEWVTAYWAHLGKRGRLWLVSVRDEAGDLVGLAPLTLTWHNPMPFRALRFFRWRQVEFIGTAAAADHLDFIAAPGQEQAVVNAILDVVWRHRFEWDVLYFSGIPETSPSLPILQQRGWVWEHLAAWVCPQVTLPQDWDTFFMALSHRKRKEQRRFLRQLEADFPGRWRCQQVTTPEQVDETLAALIDFHQAKWESQDKPGAFAEVRTVEFHHAVARHLAMPGHQDGQGRLRLFRLDIDDTLVAALYTLRLDGRVYDFASGFNFDYADYSPGQVLTQKSLEDCIATGVTHYDFLRGDEQYKFRWGAEETRDVVLRWIASPQARAIVLAHEALRRVWRLVKRALPRGLRKRVRSAVG